jgi:eukaryotic-like serine/threonine-protein kinase
MPDPALQPDGDDLLGRVLAGRYRILGKLGEGAMGAVYVGEHLTIGRRDAIKVLRPALAGDAEAIARFTRGTRNVSAIQHHNVCTIYDFSDSPDGIRFLAMEFVEGETLKDLLDREGRLEPTRAVAIARQVADGLQAAHDAGVVHRDLKPGNIMISRRPDGRELVKVVDFDIAKGPAEAEGEEVTRVGFVVGTPEYMSPEQLIGERLDGRSDLYSLGIVLFRMLSGRLPFQPAPTQEVMIQRLTGTPLRLGEALTDASPLLEQALARALARKREERQASAEEFAREITAALPGGTGGFVAGAVPPDAGGGELAPTRIASSGTALPGSPPWRRALLPAGVLAALLVAALAFLARPARDAAPAAAGEEAASAMAPVDPAEPAVSLDDLAAADAGGAESGSGRAAAAADPPPTAPPSAPAFPGGLSAMLDRQLDLLFADPAPAALRAVRDSAERGWRAARTPADSGTAALVLAQAAYLAGDLATCGRWARVGRDLGGAGFEPLLMACAR